MKAAAVLVVLAIAVAGCAEEPTASDAEPMPADEDPDPIHALSGWILTPDIRPIPGATVTIQSGPIATTDAEGHYTFPEVVRNESLILIVEAPGFETASRTTTVPPEVGIIVNVTMQPVPVKTPTSEVLDTTLFLACGAVASAGGDDYPVACEAVDDAHQDTWEFAVRPDTAGVVIEAAWEPSSPGAEFLHMTVETVGFGASDETLAIVEGSSILRAQVSEAAAAKFYSDGGRIRVTIGPSANVDESEAGTGSAVVIQQEVQVFASVFYVEGPDATYTVDP